MREKILPRLLGPVENGMGNIATILLIGYRATGKTTCGKLLARRLGWRFLDMDEVLKKRLGGEIDEVVREKGWDTFRAEEKRLLKEIVTSSGYADHVVATGGGVVLHQEAMEAMPPHILSIWLKASPRTIAHRMSMDSGTARNRPPLTLETPPSSMEQRHRVVLNEIERVLQEREPLYRYFSHLTIEVDSLTPQETTERILSHAR